MQKTLNLFISSDWFVKINSHNDIIYWSTRLIYKYMQLPLLLLAFMVGLAVGYICSYDIVVVCIAHFVSLQ